MALELSSKYRQVLSDGNFQSLCFTKPWPHFVLDDLLPKEAFLEVQQRIFSHEKYFFVNEVKASIHSEIFEFVRTKIGLGVIMSRAVFITPPFSNRYYLKMHAGCRAYGEQEAFGCAFK